MLKLNRDKEFSQKARKGLKSWGKTFKHVTYDGKEIILKSTVEHNIANYLEENNIKYTYEADLIYYMYDDEYHSYTPDFVLIDFDIMIEAKPENLFDEPQTIAKLNASKQKYTQAILVGYDISPLIEIIENVTTIESKI